MHFDRAQKLQMAPAISARYQEEENAADQVGLLIMWPQDADQPTLEPLDNALARCQDRTVGVNVSPAENRAIMRFLEEIGVQTHPPSEMRGRMTGFARRQYVHFLGFMIPKKGWGRWLYPIAIVLNNWQYKINLGVRKRQIQ